MLVKYKPTGQYGTIPDDKFDPALFERADAVPNATANPEAQVRQSLGSKVGGAILDFGKSLIAPETKLIGDTAQQIKTGTVPHQTAEDIAARFFGPMSTLFRLGGVNKAIAPSAESAASFAVPFGKGANFLTKAVLPGITMGTLQGMSEDNATPESVLGTAAVGGATAGALHGASKLFGPLLEKFGGATEEAGKTISNRVRRIKQPASIYGAGEEKAIAATLDKLGIHGSAQKQYEMLLPKMDQLGTEIDSILTKNPKTIETAAVRNDFMTNLKAAIRSKELNSKQAQQEVMGYLHDLYDAAGQGEMGKNIEYTNLFNLKQLINKDYQPVRAAALAGRPLTPRQQVIKVARQTVDDLIAEAYPEVKARTIMQSHLFDAAESLSPARFNPPTFRVAGTSVPAEISQPAQGVAGKVIQGAGAGMKAVSTLPNILGNPNVEKAATIGSTNIAGNQPQNAQEQPQENGGQDYTPSNFDHGTSITTLPPISGYTDEELATAYTKAQMAGDTKAATQIGNILSTQLSVEKMRKGSPVSANTAKQKAMASSGLRGITDMATMLNSDPTILAKSFLVPGNLLTRKYQNAAFRAAEAILRMRTGAVANQKEIERYAREFLPWFGDDAATIRYKLSQAEQDYNDMLMLYNAEDTGTSSTLPDIGGGQ